MPAARPDNIYDDYETRNVLREHDARHQLSAGAHFAQGEDERALLHRAFAQKLLALAEEAPAFQRATR